MTQTCVKHLGEKKSFIKIQHFCFCNLGLSKLTIGIWDLQQFLQLEKTMFDFSDISKVKEQALTPPLKQNILASCISPKEAKKDTNPIFPLQIIF